MAFSQQAFGNSAVTTFVVDRFAYVVVVVFKQFYSLSDQVKASDVSGGGQATLSSSSS